MPSTRDAYLHRIATAVPDHEVHGAFLAFAHGMLDDRRKQTLLLRMAERAGITSRYSVLSVENDTAAADVDAYRLYTLGSFPGTAERMRLYKRFAPLLMRRAVDRLALSAAERARIRHVLVTTCTGFYAPGLDYDIVDHLGLPHSVERTTIGFMGCYAAINALKQARHIVRSEPDSSVLIVNLELCTLHLQQTQDLGEVLSFLIFGDGCAASLVSAEPAGLRLMDFRAIRLRESADLITWHIGDQGFDMVLSGEVPAAVGTALRRHRDDLPDVATTPLWAVHPGGRSVLDAVQDALALPAAALACSRGVLHDYGNMSSATIMFVLQRMLQANTAGQQGCAMAFGPGLTAETMRFMTMGTGGTPA